MVGCGEPRRCRDSKKGLCLMAEKPEGRFLAEEGSLPEECNSKGRLLIRKRGLSEQCNSEGRLLIRKRGLPARHNSEDKPQKTIRLAC